MNFVVIAYGHQRLEITVSLFQLESNDRDQKLMPLGIEL